MNGIPTIGRCASCCKCLRLVDNACGPCRKRFGQNCGPIMKRIREDEDFAYLCYSVITIPERREAFISMFGIPKRCQNEE